MGLDGERSLGQAFDDDRSGERLAVVIFSDRAETQSEGEVLAEAETDRIGPVEARPAFGVDARVGIVVEKTDNTVVVFLGGVSRSVRLDGMGGRHPEEE
jgi:hypothetical protein